MSTDIPLNAARPAIRKIKIAEIIVGQRHRKDLGDLMALGDSIHQLGLLQPIGVTGRMELVWGERRLRACKMLGWREIDAVVDPSLDDTLRAMKAEEDENNCHLPFSHSERVAIADHIEAVERQRAEERRREGQRAGGRARYIQLGDNLSPSRNRTEAGQTLATPLPPEAQREAVAATASFGGADSAPPKNPADFANFTPGAASPADHGKTRERVAAAVGMSHDTLTKARKVVSKGVPELIEAMDRGDASVSAAARIASLPPEAQREAVAGGKAAIAAAAAHAERPRGPRRPGLVKAFEHLEALSRLPHMNLSMTALREAVADLRRELGSLLS